MKSGRLRTGDGKLSSHKCKPTNSHFSSKELLSLSSSDNLKIIHIVEYNKCLPNHNTGSKTHQRSTVYQPQKRTWKWRHHSPSYLFDWTSETGLPYEAEILKRALHSAQGGNLHWLLTASLSDLIARKQKYKLWTIISPFSIKTLPVKRSTLTCFHFPEVLQTDAFFLSRSLRAEQQSLIAFEAEFFGWRSFWCWLIRQDQTIHSPKRSNVWMWNTCDVENGTSHSPPMIWYGVPNTQLFCREFSGNKSIKRRINAETCLGGHIEVWKSAWRVGSVVCTKFGFESFASQNPPPQPFPCSTSQTLNKELQPFDHQKTDPLLLRCSSSSCHWGWKKCEMHKDRTHVQRLTLAEILLSDLWQTSVPKFEYTPATHFTVFYERQIRHCWLRIWKVELSTSTHLLYSEDASNGCPHRSKSLPFLKATCHEVTSLSRSRCSMISTLITRRSRVVFQKTSAEQKRQNVHDWAHMAYEFKVLFTRCGVRMDSIDSKHTRGGSTGTCFAWISMLQPFIHNLCASTKLIQLQPINWQKRQEYSPGQTFPMQQCCTNNTTQITSQTFASPSIAPSVVSCAGNPGHSGSTYLEKIIFFGTLLLFEDTLHVKIVVVLQLQK